MTVIDFFSENWWVLFWIFGPISSITSAYCCRRRCINNRQPIQPQPITQIVIQSIPPIQTEEQIEGKCDNVIIYS